MLLEKQVSNPELSEKLYWLDVKAPSHYTWKFVNSKCSGKSHPIEEHPRKFTLVHTSTIVTKDEVSNKHYQELAKKDLLFPAWTFAELWELLPQFLDTKRESPSPFGEELGMHKNDPKNGNRDYTFVSYGFETFSDDSPVNAIAKMLITLLEKKLIKI